MVGEFSDVLRTVETMKADGAIAEYAIGGAMAVAYWDEATYTEDLDIVILLSGDAPPLDRQALSTNGSRAMTSSIAENMQ